MSKREIKGPKVTGNFPPLVGIRKENNYVRGKVVEVSKTSANNPVITLELMDLEGSTTASVAKGVYQEVEVKVGDPVQLVGSVSDLRAKLPQLTVGDIVTVTNKGKTPLPRGKARYEFLVEVD